MKVILQTSWFHGIFLWNAPQEPLRPDRFSPVFVWHVHERGTTRNFLPPPQRYPKAVQVVQKARKTGAANGDALVRIVLQQPHAGLRRHGRPSDLCPHGDAGGSSRVRVGIALQGERPALYDQSQRRHHQSGRANRLLHPGRPGLMSFPLAVAVCPNRQHVGF